MVYLHGKYRPSLHPCHLTKLECKRVAEGEAEALAHPLPVHVICDIDGRLQGIIPSSHGNLDESLQPS